MLNSAVVRKMIESGEVVDISFWKKNGEIVHAKKVRCTSSNFENSTYNFFFTESEEVRKVKASLIFNINGEEVYL